MADELKPGDKVFYVPHADHWHDTDAAGDSVFAFVHVEDGPPLPIGRQHERARKGDPVEPNSFGVCAEDSPHLMEAHKKPLGRVERRDADGTLHTSKGYTIRPTHARKAWPGVVRDEVTVKHVEATVLHDGQEVKALIPQEVHCLVLDVPHARGGVTLHLPLEGPGAVPHDLDKGSHTYHLEGE